MGSSIGGVRRLGIAAITALVIVVAITVLPAATGDATADHVIGEVDFAHGIVNNGGADGLFSPEGIAIDRTTRPNGLYLADSLNSRVLGWSDVTKLSNGTPADVVIGQRDFHSSACDSAPTANGVGPGSLCFPYAVAVDSRGNLYAADSSNNRVLVYSSPLAQFRAHGTRQGFNAIAVFGQDKLGKDFSANVCTGGTVSTPTDSGLCFPSALALDPSDNLYVADQSNNRVLLYLDPLAHPSAPVVTADVVFGQGADGTTANAFTTGACADGENGDPAVGPTGLCSPAGVGLDSANNLYVADQSNNRVVVYLDPLAKPGSPNVTASVVFGQGGKLTTNVCADGQTGDPAPRATNLCMPSGVALDSANNLYIADQSNSRVLEYTEPLSNPKSPNLTAARVFGQGSTGTSFAASTCFNHPNLNPPSANGLCMPTAVALDETDNLYVSDGGFTSTPLGNIAANNNNRMLVYHTPLNSDSSEPGAGDVNADVVLGQQDFAHRTPNFGSPTGLNGLLEFGGTSDLFVFIPFYPFGIGFAIDNSTSPAGLYVSDPGNNRVLGWSNIDAFISGGAPNLVLGQPDFFSSNCTDGTAAGDVHGFGADSLCAPNGPAVDSAGNLYVADISDNRVLEYSNPLKVFRTTGKTHGFSANLVFGQGPGGKSFATAICADGQNGNPAPSGTTMCLPFGVTLDKSGNLYVADFLNSRVLEFNAPLANPLKPNLTANHVFGQNNKLTTNACSDGNSPDPPVSAAGLCRPESVAVDSHGNVYIADTGNYRVLEYDQPLAPPNGCKPRADGSGCPGDRIADLVFGQSGNPFSPGPTDFTSNSCNGVLNEESAFRMCMGTTVAVDRSDNLYVVDEVNNRALEFLAPLAPPDGCKPNPDGTGCPGDVVADKVFGQGPAGTSFTTHVCADGSSGDPAPNASSMCQPFSVAIDLLGNVYISDGSNNRVLEFANSSGTGPTPKPTAKATATPTRRATARATPTRTPAATGKPTPTHTPARTATHTASPSRTPAKTPSRTPGKTATPTHTKTATRTPTAKPTP